MADFFDKKDIETVEEDFFSQEDTDLAEGPSQLEAGALGAVQGASFDFGDEAYGGIKGLYDYVTSDEDKTLKEEYQEERDVARERIEAAEEAHPGTYLASDIGAGIVPGLLTGGAGAVAGIGKALGKQAAKGSLKAAAKQAAKTGAKYGAATGLGRSEAELLEGELGEVAQDVGTGAVIGAGTGVALPIAAKGVAGIGKGTKELAKKVAGTVPEAETIKAAYKYGKQGKKITEEVLDEDLLVTGKKVYENILDAKKANDLVSVKKQLDALGLKVDTKEAIESAVDDLEKIAREDILNVTNKNILPELKKLAGQDIEGDKILERATKTAIKKETETGVPSEITKLTEVGERPVAISRGLGEDKITAIVGKAEDKLQKDLENMTISEVEKLRSNLNTASKLAKAQGSGGDPAIMRIRNLAGKLKELTDDVVEKSGETGLIDKRSRMSDIFTGEELLGIDKRLSVRGDIDEAKKISQIADRLGFQKGFKTRQEGETATRLLGEDVIDKPTQEHLDLLKKVNRLVGREESENISRAGLYKKAVGDLPNAVGRAAKAVEDLTTKVKGHTIGRVANRITDLPEDTVIAVKDRLLASPRKGAQLYGEQLQKAFESDGAVRNAMIWSMSQQPAFRQLVKEELPKMDEAMSESIGEDVSSPLNSLLEEPRKDDREPAASDMVQKFETTQNTGYVPKRSSKSGVTIATGLDLGNFDLNKIELSEELKAKLEPYVGLKGNEARKVAANLQLTDEEVAEIDSAMEVHNQGEVDNLTKDMLPKYQTEDFSEGLDSMLTNSPAAAKALIDRVRSGNEDEAIDKGVEWHKSGGRFMSGLLQRRMEELYKMFPDKAELIQSEGKIEFDKYKSQTNRSWDDINTIEEKVKEVNSEIDRVNQQQSSGDQVPLAQLEGLLESLNNLSLPQEDIDGLESEAVAMDGYGDGERLKEMMRKLQGIA